MEPVKVTAILQTGQVSGNDMTMPLDSLLAAAWMIKEAPDIYYSGAMLSPDTMIDVDLSDTLERRGSGDGWYWAASFQQRAPLSESLKYWHKRFDDEHSDNIDFGKRRGSVNVKSGHYKAYRMPLRVFVFDRLTWFAFGEIKRIEGLINGITHVGKKASQGFGAIERWAVEPYPEDWSVQGQEGKLMRAIPYREASDMFKGRRERRGIRPPYWFTGNQIDALSPL